MTEGTHLTFLASTIRYHTLARVLRTKLAPENPEIVTTIIETALAVGAQPVGTFNRRHPFLCSALAELGADPSWDGLRRYLHPQEEAREAMTHPAVRQVTRWQFAGTDYPDESTALRAVAMDDLYTTLAKNVLHHANSITSDDLARIRNELAANPAEFIAILQRLL